METVRKRPLADADSSQSIAKKRIIADENDTPRANGTPPAEERDDGIDPAKLESFRKQAIFRRMKAHERESDRNRAQLEQLRERNRNTEEGLKALVACWSQLINTIRSLVPSESVVNGQDPNPPAVFDLISRSCEDPRLAEVHATVDNSLQATRDLVHKFAQSAEPQSSTTQQDAFEKYQTKCAELEVCYAEAKLKLDEAEERLSATEAHLEQAQSRYERLRTSHQDSAAASPMLTGPPTPSIPTSHPSNGVDVAMLDVMSPVDASVSRAREGELAMELNALRKVVDEQKQQLQSLQQDLYVAQHQLLDIPESRITESLPFQVVSRTLSFYQGHAHDLVKKKEELEKEYNALLEERSTYTNLAQSTAVQLDQDYQSRLEKRSTECARLRQERDQLRIALREREAKDSTALPSVSQLEALQRAQSARLDSSRAEVQRLRMRLADSTGNTEILSYLLDDDKDQTLVQRLQSRVQELEANVSSLQHGGPSLAPDSATLSQQLQQREEELRALRATEASLRKDLAATENDFIAVSGAYDDLEKQLKDPVLNLAERDKIVQESNAMRQKFELKCQIAQTEKESKEQERVTALKEKETVEQLLMLKDARLSKVTEEKNKAEITNRTLRACLDKIEAQHQLLDAGYPPEPQWQASKDRLDKAYEAYKQRHVELNTKLDAVQTDRTQLETERKKLDKAKKLFEHEKASKTTLKGADRDRHVEALEEEVKGLKEFAKCTVCKKHYRTHILTTCMHTFCKQCVDDRISARERRCMTCPTKFSAADVKQIW